MKDSSLVKIALAVSFIGLILMWWYSDSLEIGYTDINSLKDKGLDSYVKINGVVLDSKKSSKLYTINIADNTGSINVIMFNPGDLNVKKGDSLAVSGKISEYSGALQITANKIIFIAK